MIKEYVSRGWAWGIIDGYVVSLPFSYCVLFYIANGWVKYYGLCRHVDIDTCTNRKELDKETPKYSIYLH